MIENPMKTATRADNVRGTRHDCSLMTNGARTKLNRTANATGTSTSRAKYSAVTINTVTARFISAVPGGCFSLMGEAVSAKLAQSVAAYLDRGLYRWGSG